jgi:hypothetical protein
MQTFLLLAGCRGGAGGDNAGRAGSARTPAATGSGEAWLHFAIGATGAGASPLSTAWPARRATTPAVPLADPIRSSRPLRIVRRIISWR